MTRAEALIFDLDGTLVDSYEAIHESLSTAMRAKGMTPLDPPAVRRMVGRGLELLVRDAMGPENTEEGVRLYRAHYDRICLAKSKLLPGVRETLQRLHSSGLPMAVCSNKLALFTKRILEHLELAHFFRLVLGPEDVSKPKPDPEMLNLALARLSVERARSLYVGDMPMDVVVARAAGVPVAVIASGSSTAEELAASGADHVLTSIEELLSLVESRRVSS